MCSLLRPHSHRGHLRPLGTGCQGTQPLGSKAEVWPHQRGGKGRPGEALGSWVARQTSKPQRILSPQGEARPQLVLWERVNSVAWRASDLLGLGHRRGRSGTQPLASGGWAGGGEVSTGGSKAWPRGGGLGAAAGPVADAEQLWSRRHSPTPAGHPRGADRPRHPAEKCKDPAWAGWPVTAPRLLSCLVCSSCLGCSSFYLITEQDVPPLLSPFSRTGTQAVLARESPELCKTAGWRLQGFPTARTHSRGHRAFPSAPEIPGTQTKPLLGLPGRHSGPSPQTAFNEQLDGPCVSPLRSTTTREV